MPEEVDVNQLFLVFGMMTLLISIVVFIATESFWYLYPVGYVLGLIRFSDARTGGDA